MTLFGRRASSLDGYSPDDQPARLQSARIWRAKNALHAIPVSTKRVFKQQKNHMARLMGKDDPEERMLRNITVVEYKYMSSEW
ncbi:uncharacterized protein LOC62_05G007684 [Vanrija pseudolonga]|uniref:Uncharacterized protein n=1 Tax=Vanrija pseudolonga TaxID=143232 RepID=A0AAF1BT04_9TREE|nr:hypothetical protein LOC62_05G007684 [Vanrija pseudolonga]